MCMFVCNAKKSSLKVDLLQSALSSSDNRQVQMSKNLIIKNRAAKLHELFSGVAQLFTLLSTKRLPVLLRVKENLCNAYGSFFLSLFFSFFLSFYFFSRVKRY